MLFRSALLGMDLVHFKELIREAMSGEVMEANIDILDAAYEIGRASCRERVFPVV